MAQVEALSMGKYLIANDDSTMNDYITNKKIGIFYNYSKSSKLNINNVLNYKKYRLNYAKNGFKKFEKNKKKIINLFKKKYQNKKNILTDLLLLILVKFYTLKRKLIMLPNTTDNY